MSNFITKSVSKFFEPLSEILLDLKSPTIEIIHENDTSNKDRLIILPTNNQSKIFRPENFNQYIGQDKAKNILSSYITAIKERKVIFPHTLIYGNAGCGKTTLARIVAKELNQPMKEIITNDITDLELALWNLKDSDNPIVFFDEIHKLPRQQVELIYTAMEDFKLNDVNVKPFTLIGATTELGEILKDRRPFYDRFKIIIELEEYKIEEISKIINQYKDQTFPLDKIDNNIYIIISENSKGTPRTGIRLLEATVYLKDVNKVLNNFDIIKEGFTNKDLKVLKYIALNEKGVGLQGLASYLGISEQNYLQIIEPYLLRNNLIIRTSRGRKITNIGQFKIKELNDLIK